MKQFVSQIWHSSAARNVGKLLSANIIAQAIGLLIYPILTRLYSPEDFGVLGLYVSLAGTIAMIATANYQNAITLPKEDKQAIGVFQIGFFLLLASTILTACTIPFCHQIACWFKRPELAQLYWTLPIYIFALGLWPLLNNWYIRTKKFSATAAYQINLSLTSAGGKVGMSYICPSASGLISASIAGAWISLVANVIRNWRKSLYRLSQGDKTTCLAAAKTYKNFPLYSLPQSLVNQVSGQLPVWLLLPVFGAEKIGLWNMALLLSFTPLSLIAKALNQVFYQHLSEHVNQKQTIRKFYTRFVSYGLLALIPFFFGLWFILPALTEWLLGHEWREAGEYIRWLLPWLCLATINSGISFIPDLFFRQRLSLFFEIALLILRAGAILASYLTNNFIVGVAGISLANCIICTAQLIWYRQMTDAYDRRLKE